MDGTIKKSKLIFYKTESSQNLVELINIKNTKKNHETFQVLLC